jgi:hypothetical protein
MNPLYLNASSYAYIINQTFCIQFKGLFGVICSLSAVLVVGPFKGVALFDFTSSGNEKNLLIPTDSYFYNGESYGTTGCALVYSWLLYNQVNANTNVISTLGLTFNNARYRGLVGNVGSCGANLAVI